MRDKDVKNLYRNVGRREAGEKFAVSIVMDKSVLTVTSGEDSVTYDYSFKNGDSIFFKAGNYGQEAGDDGTKGAIVKMHSLSTTH